jgi:hypothetical protein
MIMVRSAREFPDLIGNPATGLDDIAWSGGQVKKLVMVILFCLHILIHTALAIPLFRIDKK